MVSLTAPPIATDGCSRGQKTFHSIFSTLPRLPTGQAKLRTCAWEARVPPSITNYDAGQVLSCSGPRLSFLVYGVTEDAQV